MLVTRESSVRGSPVASPWRVPTLPPALSHGPLRGNYPNYDSTARAWVEARPQPSRCEVSRNVDPFQAIEAVLRAPDGCYTACTPDSAP